MLVDEDKEPLGPGQGVAPEHLDGLASLTQPVAGELSPRAASSSTTSWSTLDRCSCSRRRSVPIVKKKAAPVTTATNTTASSR